MKVIFGGIFFSLLGLFSIYLYYVNSTIDKQMAQWPKVKATIISTKIIEHVYVSQSGGPTSRSIANPVWMPVIEYKFSIDGKEYTGHKFSNASDGTIPRKTISPPDSYVKMIQNEYKPGSQIDISYYPIDPMNNFIHFQKRGFVKWILYVGIVFVVVGLLVTYKGIRTYQS